MKISHILKKASFVILSLLVLGCSYFDSEKTDLNLMLECESKHKSFQKNLVGRWEGKYEGLESIPDTVYEKSDTSMNFLFETSNKPDTALKRRVVYEVDTVFKPLLMEFRYVGTDSGVVYIETRLEGKLFSINGHCSILDDKPFDVFIRDNKKYNSNGLKVISKVLHDSVSTIYNIDLELISLNNKSVTFQIKNGFGKVELKKVEE